MTGIPIASSGTPGFLHALSAARSGDPAALASWFRRHGGFALDEFEREEMARFLEALHVPKAKHAPLKLSPLTRSAVILEWSNYYAKPEHERPMAKVLRAELAERFRVSPRTIESLAAKGRALHSSRKK